MKAHGNKNGVRGFLMAGGSLALAVCLAGAGAMAQERPPQDQPPQEDQGQTEPQGPQGSYQPPYDAQGQGPEYSQPAPNTLTLPAGTVISARLIDWLSSDKNQPGDRFSASLEQPLVAGGWVVARRGQIVTGRVVTAKKAGHGSDVSQLGVELSELTLVDGQVLPVSTQLVQSSAGRSRGADGAIVGTTTGIGAVIGAIAGGGEGAAIGAGAGAAAGIIGVLSTHGKPTVLPSETLLSFRLEEPLAISTERGSVAFHPVNQGDYGDQDAYARPRTRGPRPYGAYPYAYPYPYGYPYPYYYTGWGYYPPLYFGFGGYYGRGYYRGGFRR